MAKPIDLELELFKQQVERDLASAQSCFRVNGVWLHERPPSGELEASISFDRRERPDRKWRWYASRYTRAHATYQEARDDVERILRLWEEEER